MREPDGGGSSCGTSFREAARRSALRLAQGQMVGLSWQIIPWCSASGCRTRDRAKGRSCVVQRDARGMVRSAGHRASTGLETAGESLSRNSFQFGTDTKGNAMQPHKIVSHEEWLAARKAHLRNEKALTRMRDIVAAERRALPWVKVTKNYVFDTAQGKKSLADLFGDNSQLIVHHFMWRHDLDSGCPSCSLEADHAEGALVHLDQSRCELCARRARADREASRLQQAPRLEGRMGVVAEQRLQLRLSRVVHQGASLRAARSTTISRTAKKRDYEASCRA